MLWFILAIVLFPIAYDLSTDRVEFVTNIVLIVTLVFALNFVFAINADEQKTSYPITTPITRQVVNDQPKLTFDTQDGRHWSLDLRTPTSVGSENALVIAKRGRENMLLSLMYFGTEAKSLVIRPN